MTVENRPELAAFSKEIHGQGMMPLWERPAGMMQPGSACVPALWRYEAVRPQLMTASRLIAKKEAERRVLVLENPALRGTTQITNTLYAGLQIILPGEIAPSHRHTANALRFVVEGEGAYTAVGGEKIPMQPGDFIVTPGWSWHDHGNVGTGPVIWIDGLDTPFTRFFGANFREDLAEDRQNLFLPEGHSLAAFGTNMLPIDHAPQTVASPVLHYPYERSRAALAHLARTTDPHAVHGTKLRYANPSTGRHPFTTIATFMQVLPKGFLGKGYRTTEGTVFHVVEGGGRVFAGDEVMEVGERDIFVVPCWVPHRFEIDRETVLFSYSDRAGQEALGFWREQVG
jgi:gentisate 1,2-dioxygenase